GDRLEELLGDLVVRRPALPVLSSVDPDAAEPVLDASYWGRNVRDAVRFWPAVDRLLAERNALFLEIGPHPVLSRPLRAALSHRGRGGPVVSSLARGKAGSQTLAAALATLYPMGAAVDWTEVHAGTTTHVPLPPVVLAGERHWLPGVARGEQGGPVAGVATGGLRAEVRLFDGANRLVATLGDAGAAPVAGAAAPARSTPVNGTSTHATPLRDTSAIDAFGTGAQAPVETTAGSRPSTEQVTRAVGRIAAEVLGVGADQRLSRVRGFYEIGFDSFSIVELVNRLKAEFGVHLSAGAAIEHPSIDELTEHILASDPKSAATAPVPATIALPGATGDPGPAERVPESDPWPGGAEPIAIVGMGCRLPGATGLDEYWALLTDGVDATGVVPADRWNAAALLTDDAGAAQPGRVSTGRGAFVDGIDQFDNAFFRVSAREARSMDPQQRMFLEVAWEAMEDAGLDVDTLRGRRTGLFVGLNTTDYQQLLAGRPDQVDLYYGTGNTFSGTAGRMSYFLGVRGPSLAVDTACASSLTAVHLGVQSLRSGESDIAVVGGSNALLTPTVYLAMSAGGALAPDGRCKTFDASADGYGRGEGAGAVVLKTLSRAIADGDRVHAVIRGSAVNHNGASGGLTVPSAEAQAEVIRTALAQGGVPADAVDYVEAHGTGTPLGDPVELNALDRALGEGRPADRPLLVGSVKTNIAHLEAAAGVAGLIKAALSLRHGEIPAHLNFHEPTAQVDWDRLRVRVVANRTPWPTTGRPRVAGVSAFGFTGTNAHVVLSEAPTPTPAAPAVSGRAFALAVSAASPAALGQAAELVRARLETASDDELADLCHTLGARRSHLEHRLVVVGSTRARILHGLRTAWSSVPEDGQPVYQAHCRDGVAVGSARVGERTRFAAVFGDSVADLDWARFDAEEPVFRAKLDEAQAWHDVRGALLARQDDPVAVVAAQIALAALWADHGVRPHAVVGRGVGERAAAHVAGAVSLLDALAGGELRHTARPTVPLHLASAHDGPAGITAALVDEGVETVLDIGFGQAAEQFAAPGLAALAPDGPLEPAALVRAVAALHVGGVPVDWPTLSARRGVHVSAPGYPWQHVRHWVDVSAPDAPPPADGPTPALGASVRPPGAPGVRYYPVRLPARSQAPAAAEVTDLLVAAGRDLFGDGAVELRDLDLGMPVLDGRTANAQLVCHRDGHGWSRSLTSSGDRAAAVLARALLTRPDSPAVVNLGRLLGRLPAHVLDESAIRNGTWRRDLKSPDAAERLAWLRLGSGTAGLVTAAAGLLAPDDDHVVVGIGSVRVFAPAADDVLLHAHVDTGSVQVLDPTGQVLAELDGVAFGPAREFLVPEDLRGRLASRLYAVRWQPAALPAPPVTSTGRYLVSGAGPADATAAVVLADALRDRGAEAAVVSRVEDWRALLATEPVSGAVVVTGPDSGDAATATLLAAQAVAAGASARLWLVTRGARDVDGTTPPDRGQAAAWGLARVLAMEAPAAWGGCVDLPLGSDDYAAAADRVLAADLTVGPVEDELCLRDGRWHVPRLVHVEPPAVLPAGRCRDDAWYAVVGGLTSATEPFVDALVAAGARKLLDIGPGRQPDPGRLAGLAAAGVEVRSSDLTDGMSGDALAAIGVDQVAGVVVAPPVHPVRPLQETTPQHLFAGQEVVDLVARLVRALRGERLDFVHVVGSAAAEWGSAGMAAQSALDGALHAVVAEQAASGVPAAVVRWMPWSDGGELTRRDRLMMENSGLTPLADDVVAETAAVLLRAGYADVGVAVVDEARYAEACRTQTDRGFLTALDRPVPSTTPSDDVAVPPLVAQLLALDPDLRADRLLDAVMGHVADVLGAGGGAGIDPDRGYFELGMDSVMSISLKTRLDSAMGVALPVTLTFEYPTGRALATHLLTTLPRTDAPEDPPAPAFEDGLDELSDDELLERLLAGLANSGHVLGEED
ncbi:MAG: beta-ketoacyl synthase N-terminal-like domain-containing protein, partial [Umezawaea sp.]